MRAILLILNNFRKSSAKFWLTPTSSSTALNESQKSMSPAEMDLHKTSPLIQTLASYSNLSKARLSSLVVATALAGFGMCPVPCGFSAGVLGASALTVGTALTSFSANAWNQIIERSHDAKMKRTQSRVLVRKTLTVGHAKAFAVTCAVTGVTTLWIGVNPMVAGLGLGNIFLYATVYTPMKRVSLYNTWIGSVVGAVPPLMGWAACSGGQLDAGAVVLAALLFSWQFPHFNALSWNLRDDYARAGYRMMATDNHKLLRATTMRHAAALTGLCSVAVPLTQLTTWTFAATSLPLNFYMGYLSYQFYQEPSSRTARDLFRYTLAYLPLLMLLLIVSKKEKKKEPAATVEEENIA